MCGFVAVITRDSSFNVEILNTMRDVLAHRGPDGAGTWIHKNENSFVGFGHRRLAIVDLSEAAGQPMVDHDTSCALVFNGEIYNFIELRRELEALGHKFRTLSDTEVLLKAYNQWGPESIERLDGMFAFAICDVVNRRIFIGRDRFGEKPLFYTLLPNGGLAFASEMKALFAHPDVHAHPDLYRLSSFIARGSLSRSEKTMFIGIQEIQPATASIIDFSGTWLRQWTYWKPELTHINEKDYANRKEMLKELLFSSIKDRLRTDVPVGTSLSGGLDSSIILGAQSRILRDRGAEPPHAFSARFDRSLSVGEAHFVDLALRYTPAVGHGVTPQASTLLEDIEKLHFHQEEPFPTASIFLQWEVMKLAQEKDVKVLLDGQGADELFAGYHYFFYFHQLDILSTKPNPEQVAALVRETLRFQRIIAPGGISNKEAYRATSSTLMQPDELEQRLAFEMPTEYEPIAGGPYWHPQQIMRVQMIKSLLRDSLPHLLRYADRNSMAFGREVRLPYLQRDLVNFSLSLPETDLLQDGWTKRILREAGEGLAPLAICWRGDKIGYEAPLGNWLRGELKELVTNYLFEGPITLTPGYEASRIQRAWEDHVKGSVDNSSILWPWLSGAIWLDLANRGVWKSEDHRLVRSQEPTKLETEKTVNFEKSNHQN